MAVTSAAPVVCDAGPVLALLQVLPQRSSLFLRAEFLAGIVERFKQEYRL
jgi:hypothetical protein